MSSSGSARKGTGSRRASRSPKKAQSSEEEDESASSSPNDDEEQREEQRSRRNSSSSVTIVADEPTPRRGDYAERGVSSSTGRIVTNELADYERQAAPARSILKKQRKATAKAITGLGEVELKINAAISKVQSYMKDVEPHSTRLGGAIDLLEVVKRELRDNISDLEQALDDKKQSLAQAEATTVQVRADADQVRADAAKQQELRNQTACAPSGGQCTKAQRACMQSQKPCTPNCGNSKDGRHHQSCMNPFGCMIVRDNRLVVLTWADMLAMRTPAAPVSASAIPAPAPSPAQ